jgi:hypothetical protein
MLTSCAPSAKSFFPIENGEAVSVIKSVVTMDGNREGNFSMNCSTGFTDAEGKVIPAVKDRDSSYYIMKTKAGLVNVSGVSCLGYKVFYNKLRTYKFKDVTFEAKAGTINYVGDLNVDWETSSFNVGDIIGAGGFEIGSGNEGTLKMQVSSENLAAAQKFMQEQQLPVEGTPFRVAPLSGHELLTK